MKRLRTCALDVTDGTKIPRHRLQCTLRILELLTVELLIVELLLVERPSKKKSTFNYKKFNYFCFNQILVKNTRKMTQPEIDLVVERAAATMQRAEQVAGIATHSG